MAKPAIRKIDFYKLHKSLYDYKTDCEKKARESMEKLQHIMPIYSKQDIIQIKNGNIYPVLSFNAAVRPNSASSRVLKAETDPINNLKRKFYRNSNKPLGNSGRHVDFHSKKNATTI